jgi:hypothetical protein
MANCAGCQAAIDPAMARFDHNGRLVCEACGARADSADAARVAADYQSHRASSSIGLRIVARLLGLVVAIIVAFAIRACDL